MPYIHFTDEQKLRANSVDLVEFLRRQGEKLIHPAVTSALHPDHSITVRGKSGMTMRPRKVEALSLLYRPSMD